MKSKLKYDEIYFADIILILANNIKILIILPIIFGIAMILYVQLLSEPVYEATSKIMSSSQNTKSQVTGLAAQFGINFNNESNTKWVYPEILKSRTIARRMINRKFDTEKYGSNITLYDILIMHYNLSYNQKRSVESEISAVSKFLSLVNVNEEKSTGIFTIKLSGFEPQLTVDLSSSLIEELDQHQKLYNKRKTQESKKFIDSRIAETKKELNQIEENLKNFIDSNRRIENSPSLQLERERLAREVSVLTGVFTTLKQQLETLKIEQVKDENYVIILDKPEMPLTPSKPKKLLLILTSSFFGLFLGFIYIFLNELILNQNQKNKETLIHAKSVAIENLRKMLF